MTRSLEIPWSKLFPTHVYCEVCDDHMPAIFEPMEKDKLNKKSHFKWGDVVCKECSFVVATFSYKKGQKK